MEAYYEEFADTDHLESDEITVGDTTTLKLSDVTITSPGIIATTLTDTPCKITVTDQLAVGLRGLIASYKALNKYNPCSEYGAMINELTHAYYLHQARVWRRSYQKVKAGEKHNESLPVPFCKSEVMTLPLDSAGNVIVDVPELKGGVWYDHIDGSMTPSSPGAYLNEEVLIDIYDRHEGLKSSVQVKDVNWALVKQYRKSETVVADDLTDFGLF